MAVQQDLIEILVCPETQQSLTIADEAVLAKINEDITAGRLRNRGGDKVEKAVNEGLVREDGRVLYPVDDGIPVMLVEEASDIPESEIPAEHR